MSLKQEAYEKIVEKSCQIFGKSADEITEDTTFDGDLKAKSTNITLMLNYLEDEFDVELPYMKFRRCKTVGEAAAFVADQFDE